MTKQTNHVAKTARWMVVCASFVGGFEGLACTAYPDKLAHGLPTVCYGETEGVHLGDHYSPEQCRDMLATKLPRYWSDAERCIHVPVSDNEKIAYTSFSYNLGVGAFCKGIAPLVNRGNHRGACEHMLAYDHASGRKVAGLTRRRQSERLLCLTPDKTDMPVTIDLNKDKPEVTLARPRVSFWTYLGRWIKAHV